MYIFFMSLGCDKNLVDSEFMLGKLTKHQYTVTDDETEADVIVINTCCFIHDAKEESIQTILEMAEYKKEYAGLTAKEITDETRKRNEILAKEIYLSVGRYKLRKKVRMIKKLHEAFKAAMERVGEDFKKKRVFPVGPADPAVAKVNDIYKKLHDLDYFLLIMLCQWLIVCFDILLVFLCLHRQTHSRSKNRKTILQNNGMLFMKIKEISL